MEKTIKTGVVATRERNGRTEVLLISTKNNGWGVPKGNLMPELGKKKTALEEAYEEAGVLGEIVDGRKATIEHPERFSYRPHGPYLVQQSMERRQYRSQ